MLICVKKKWSIKKMIQSLSGFTTVLKMHFRLYEVKIDIYMFIHRMNA